MTSISDALRDWVASHNEDALLADGFEAAIVGMAERCGQPSLVVYDADKCVEILMTRDGMDHEEASEFFSFNTLGSWVGANTPLFLWRKPDMSDHTPLPEDMINQSTSTAEIETDATTPCTAKIDVFRAGEMTTGGRATVAAWLRSQADELERDGANYAEMFIARYNPEDAVNP